MGKSAGIFAMSEETIEEIFPRLGNEQYSITSPETIEYNCIGWAAKDDERWWWPDAMAQYYWPPGVPREESLEAFVQAFETLGYQICNSASFEEGFEKVAIYVNPTGKPTHASRQLKASVWTSKLGSLEDIEHDFESVSGSQYGTVAVIMKRRI